MKEVTSLPNCCKKLTTPKEDLPVLIEYVHSIDVIFILFERNVTGLKSMFRANCHSLNNRAALYKLPVKQIMIASFINCSFGNLEQRKLTSLLYNVSQYVKKDGDR